MTAPKLHVRTTEPVQTWSTTITANVLTDLMAQTVKTVSTTNAALLSDPNEQNAKMRLEYSV